MDENEQNVTTEHESKPYAQKLLPIIIIAVTVYAVADIVLQAKYDQEISTTLTTAWFSFWGVEIMSLATIKVVKTKSNRSSKDSNDKTVE